MYKLRTSLCLRLGQVLSLRLVSTYEKSRFTLAESGVSSAFVLSSEVALAEAELEGSVAVVKSTAARVVGVTISDTSDSHSKSRGTSTK